MLIEWENADHVRSIYAENPAQSPEASTHENQASVPDPQRLGGLPAGRASRSEERQLCGRALMTTTSTIHDPNNMKGGALSVQC